MPELQQLLASPYYTALIAGIALAASLSWRAATREGVNPISWATLLAGAAAGGLLGSKFLFFDLQPAALGEKTILGGLLLGMLVVMALAWLLGLGAARTLDRLTVPTLAAMAVGRVGCFFAECCLGVHSELLGHRHPTVLYEAALDIVLIGLISQRVPRSRPGMTIGVGVTGYAGIRFATEFLRDRPEFGAGLNPVQWLMLLTVVGIGLWTVLRARRARLEEVNMPRVNPAVAALLVALSIIVIATGMTPWVIPPEQIVLLWIGAGLLTVPLRALGAVPAIRAAPRVALASAPAIGLYLMLQDPQPAEQPRRAKYTVGARTWGSYYDKVAGQYPDVFVPAGCGYDGCSGVEECWGDHYEPGPEVNASRSTRVSALSASVQLPVEAPSLFELDGMLFVGNDVSTRPATAVELRGVETVPIRGVGVAMTTGEPNFLFRFGAMAGSLSRNGRQVTTATPNVMVRIGGARGFYFEGNGVDRAFLSTHGDFSYLGLGYLHTPSRIRAYYGGGAHGQVFSAGFPLGRAIDVDLTRRDPDRPDNVPRVAPNWQLGARYRYR